MDIEQEPDGKRMQVVAPGERPLLVTLIRQERTLVGAGRFDASRPVARFECRISLPLEAIDIDLDLPTGPQLDGAPAEEDVRSPVAVRA